MFRHVSIAFRQLFSKHSFGFVYITSILGVLGLAIGIASLIIISCVSDGFSNLVNTKLSSIDGHFRITNYYNDSISIPDANNIMDVLNSNAKLKSSYLYTENHAMIKSKNLSEGVIVYGCSDSALTNIFNLDDFLIAGSISNINFNSAVLGSLLATNLDLEIGDEFYLFNIEDIVKQNKINALKLNLNAIIDTEFSEYDRLLAFIPFATSQVFFSDSLSATGIISSVYSPMEVDVLENSLFESLLEFPVYITSWKDRHHSIISWLNIYDIPIKLIMMLIVLVSIFNLTATIWMVSFERKSEYGILKAMGFMKHEVKNIILTQSLLLSTIGSCFGIALALIALIGQHYFHWISLSSDIYFMNYLPVSFTILSFLFYPLFGILLSLKKDV